MAYLDITEKYMGLVAVAILIIFITIAIHYRMLKQRRYIKQLISLKDSLHKEIEERKVIQERLSKFATIVDSSNDAIICSFIDGTIISWNKSAEEIYGYKEEEMMGSNINILFPEGSKDEISNLAEKLKRGFTVKNFETKRIRKDGAVIDIAITLSPIRDECGNIISVAAIDRDITERVKDQLKLEKSYEELSAVYGQLFAAEAELKQQIEELKNHEKALRSSEERYKLAVEGANDAIWEMDFQKNTFFISDKWKAITALDENEIKNIRAYMRDRVHEEDIETAFKDLKRHLKGKTDYYQSEFRVKVKDGTYKWVNNRGKALKDEHNKVIKMAGSVTDINETKKIHEKIKYIAYYDNLTGLPNRAMLMDSLEKITKEFEEQNKKLGVIFLDIDDFKIVNDLLGHDYGDDVIKTVANILRSTLPENSILARSGGDEFVILLKDIEGSQIPMEFCENILKIFKSPIMIKGNRVYTSASMGIAIYPSDATSSKELLSNADTAMFKSKQNGKNQYNFFNKNFTEDIKRKVAIEKGLREALVNNEFILYYQPQFSLVENKIEGFEALIRWNNKELGWVSPAEFISIAEESGMINEIGKWVIKEACKENRRLRQLGYKFETMAINISPVQFQDPNFLKDIYRITEETEVDPSQIELEITEGVLMSLYDRNLEVLNKLRAMKFKIALDDFGTGYSSLSYLRLLPINKLKIDKSFIDHIEKDKNNKDITEGIIQLSHKMGMEVIAEGVEDEKQLKILKQMGCDKIQGYYFSKPIPKHEIEKLYEKLLDFKDNIIKKSVEIIEKGKQYF